MRRRGRSCRTTTALSLVDPVVEGARKAVVERHRGLRAAAASARIKNADVGINPTYQQTGPGQTRSYSTAVDFFSARVFFSALGPIHRTGTLTLPRTRTLDLLRIRDISRPLTRLGTKYTAASLSALQATYPTGTYTFDVSGGTGPATMVSQNYAGDTYSNTPLVTNFSALQGLNAADAFTVDLNGMVVSPNATPDAIQHLFLHLQCFHQRTGLQRRGTADRHRFVIPGGTLAAGTSPTTYDLVYDDRIVGTTGDDSPITLTQFYDIGTAGDFSTAAGAVPEPSTWAML